MLEPYIKLSLADRLQLLAFEAELAHLPRSLITALWNVFDRFHVMDDPSPHERSDKAWLAYREAAEKLDYFLVGLSAALAGYLGQQISLNRIGFNGPTAELVSVILFGLSMVAGIRRIEWMVAGLAKNQEMLRHGESAGSLVKVAGEAQTPTLVNVGTGDVFSRGNALTRAQLHRQVVDKLEDSVDRAYARARRAYHWRNRFFYAGVACLVVARILEAYLD